MTAKAVTSPAPIANAQPNTNIASIMLAAHAEALPKRPARRTHNGRLRAPATKYAGQQRAGEASGARSTSSMKNSTVDAGIAAAMPLAANTPRRRRKSRSPSASNIAAKMGPRCARGRPGRPQQQGRQRERDQQGQEQPAAAHQPERRVPACGEQRRQTRREDHPQQTETFPPGHDAGTHRRILSELRTPGMVVDGGKRIARGNQHQQGTEPQRTSTRWRVEQADHAQRQHRQRRADQRSPPRDAIAEPAQQRIAEGVHHPGNEQHRADQRQRQGQFVGIELGHVHIDRQGREGERQSERTVGGEARIAGTGGAPGRRCTPFQSRAALPVSIVNPSPRTATPRASAASGCADRARSRKQPCKVLVGETRSKSALVIERRALARQIQADDHLTRLYIGEGLLEPHAPAQQLRGAGAEPRDLRNAAVHQALAREVPAVAQRQRKRRVGAIAPGADHNAAR